MSAPPCLPRLARFLLPHRSMNAVQGTTATDLHQFHERERPLRHLGFQRLPKRVQVHCVVWNGGIDPADCLIENGGTALGRERDGISARHETMPGEKARDALRGGTVERASRRTKSSTRTLNQGFSAGASHVWVKNDAESQKRLECPQCRCAPRRSGGVKFYTVPAVAVVWWFPTIVLVFARPTLFQVSFSYRARRASRLMEAGNLVEADRVIARLRWEAERYQRRIEAQFICDHSPRRSRAASR